MLTAIDGAGKRQTSTPHSRKRMTLRRDCLTNIFCIAGLLAIVGCATVPPAAAPAPPAAAQAGGATIVAVAAPAPPATTLPQFLGLDLVFGGAQKATLCVRNRLGARFPGLEPKPPVKSITDPANLEPGASPAVQAAAKAKAEEDQAPQKAKAIRYLASRGCGECFPDTEDALLAALDDCNETIRYEVVRGLQSSVGGCCQSCKENSCCTEKLIQKLYKMAYGRDDYGCFVESSARVRRNARLVICKCGGGPTTIDGAAPLEGPGDEVIISEHAELSGASIALKTNEPADVDLTSVAQGFAQQIRSLESGSQETALPEPSPNDTKLRNDAPRRSIGSGVVVANTPLGSSNETKTVGFILPATFDAAQRSTTGPSPAKSKPLH
ncbi:hypothetical protein LOC67_23005 [Stieleria sp. JC731]|uniref:hypothetical protein n=1 Tax=Pirellulaceae TaxID=2691357 RepID=UPI001E4B51DA|nr:hypothetical protein [Stieleria sp. JC731]MCC9603428.1 hypothetical protein [Stieleria sp. JC731]